MSFTTLQTPKTSTSSTSASTSASTKAKSTSTTSIRFTEPQAPPLNLTKRSVQPIWSWTFKAEAVAECFIKDVLQMTENKIENLDFFWLGRVPCRTVQTVGIVVGVQVYDRKVVYTVDDGTDVIDCDHIVKQSTFEPNANVSKYVMPAVAEPPQPPKPVAILGDFVKIIGRVKPSFETRKIIAQTVDKCLATDEMAHLRNVRKLHATYYDIDEEWVLPTPPTPVPVPVTPKKVKISTPAPVPASIPNPSTGKSTIAESVTSSPVLPVINEATPQIPQTPRKLRHPSRLHTQDLTDATFRIYLKHYMDHSPIPVTPSESDDDDDEIPPPSSQPDPWATPRPSQSKSKSRTRSSSTPTTLQGFTLSYLRRVPELALLAARVVQAHTKRKAREERKKLKESGNPTSTKSQARTPKELPPDKAAPKIKRLFQWAIKQLYMDGCIVIWDGPVRAIQNGARGDTSGIGDLSALWKYNNSTIGSTYPSTMSAADNSMFSSTTNQSIINDTFESISAEMGYISDASPSEESYISLTPLYLGPVVEGVVKDLVDRNASVGKPYAGVSVEGVVGQLKRDDRWRYLGAWSVEDALVVLEAEGKVWKMGNGKWDIAFSE